MTLASLLISAVSVLLSLTVAYLTLWRRGALHMTRPVQVGLLYEHEQPKVFLRSMLYATGKRGHIIEALYLKVRCGESTQTFNFWVYGESTPLMIGSGLRVGEDGVSFNHHFLPPRGATFEFLAGEYVVDVYAQIISRRRVVRLSTVKLSLSDRLAVALRDPSTGWVQFLWGPDSQGYDGDVVPLPTTGRARSISGASGKLPWT